MRAVALVVAVVLAIIGVGVAAVGGLGRSLVPQGWVAITYSGAQIAIPPTWQVVYDYPCSVPIFPGVIYVDHGPQQSDLCSVEANVASAPVVTIRSLGRYYIGAASFINGIEVAHVYFDGVTSIAVPSLGVQVTATGIGYQGVLDTLTTAPD